MHFQMKIQPIDGEYGQSVPGESPAPAPVKPKSRLKRLFIKHSSNGLNGLEKVNGAGEVKDGSDLEPSSVCLDKMVQNFIEDAPEKTKCGRSRCNCFNGSVIDASDDEFDVSVSESLKSLTQCASVTERNLLADASNIIEMNKFCKRKDELRKRVAQGLLLSGYDASVCRSRWEKTSSYPAGEYEYIDVVVETGERILIDIEFRSEFEIARPSGSYNAIVQSLPYVFVGQADRLQQILLIVTDAARLSLKKEGMHVPPWRKYEYMRSKWLSAHVRTASVPATPPPTPDATNAASKQVFSQRTALEVKETSELSLTGVLPVGKSDDGFESLAPGVWQPPAIKPRNVERGSKLVVTGLASLFREKA